VGEQFDWANPEISRGLIEASWFAPFEMKKTGLSAA
jgi:hypothetical protein